MNAHGFVHKYGDNVDTDVIIPARYLTTSVPSELAAHCHVPLTAVSVELERMSVDSVKTLFRRQRHPNAPRCLYSYNPTLRERSSVAMPREKMA
mgnify:CR=1 FL=1